MRRPFTTLELVVVVGHLAALVFGLVGLLIMLPNPDSGRTTRGRSACSTGRWRTRARRISYLARLRCSLRGGG